MENRSDFKYGSLMSSDVENAGDFDGGAGASSLETAFGFSFSASDV